MKVRIKFSKHGTMRFVGHLDLMRFFQKAIRRSGLPIRYSEGFSPHQIMSFAAPLGMGLESDCEIVDMEFTEAVESREGLRRLNDQMCDGITILEWKEIPKETKPAMSTLSAATYEIECDITEEEIQRILSSSEWILRKTNKKGQMIEKDIRPLLYDMKKTERGVWIHVAQGSTANLRPEDVVPDYRAITRKSLTL